MQRQTLVEVIAEIRNTWMHAFAYASHHVAAAVVVGRISAEQINAFDITTYADDAARPLAEAAGMVYVGADEINDDAETCDAEDISVAVEALAGLQLGDAGIHEHTWSLYEDTLTDRGVTLLDVTRAMRHYAPTVKDAACLILDADRWLTKGVMA